MSPQEDKKLLLIDLCARLLHGVKCCVENHYNSLVLLGVERLYKGTWSFKKGEWVAIFWNDTKRISDIKPYLRPMSSMTKKEALKLWDLLYSSYRRNKILEIIIKQECIDYILNDKVINGVASTETFSIYYDNVVRTIDTFDWLNFHHFDYRGLIEKGLVIEAPADMYKV